MYGRIFGVSRWTSFCCLSPVRVTVAVLVARLMVASCTPGTPFKAASPFETHPPHCDSRVGCTETRRATTLKTGNCCADVPPMSAWKHEAGYE